MSEAPAFVYEGADLDAMEHAVSYRRWILDELRPYLDRRILEVGAGTGTFSSLLLDEIRPERFVAVEPSAPTFRQLACRIGRTAGVVLHRARFGDIAPHYLATMDSVLYVNVLEHVDDDRAEFSAALRVLRPGGHLCIFVPALQWLYSDFDRSVGHKCRYYKRRLRTELECYSGFDVVHARYFDVLGVLPWLASMRLLGGTLTAAKVRAYDRWVVPVARRLESFLPLPIGKNLLMVARKPSE